MPHIGISELLVVLMILLLVFGASRLPALGEGLGRTLRQFKRGLSSEDKIQFKKPSDKSEPQAANPPKDKAAAARPRPDDPNISDAEIVDKS